AAADSQRCARAAGLSRHRGRRVVSGGRASQRRGGMSLLRLLGGSSGYGASQVLFDVDLTVSPGQVVTLLGRNGMGKTTTLRTLFGVLPLRAGRLEFGGRDVTGWAPDRIARLGMAIVPEGRQCFPNLTVREHLEAFAAD